MLHIKIHPPKALHNIGQRDNNEDNIYPLSQNATNQNNYFLVCDGVGGANKGEVASMTTCIAYSQYFEENPIDVPDEAYFKKALAYVQARFDEQLTQSGYRGMGTTMTTLYLHNQGATIAHIGDSRIYHIRDGAILSVTHDHSLVNQLIEAEIITPEEALTHPQRNVITRAIQGSHRPTKTEVAIITDIEAEDYFFLCTDGVLESITDEILCNILGNATTTNTQKIKEIETVCTKQSKDNFSAYLIQIEAIEGEILVEAEEVELAEDEDIPVGEIIEDAEKTKEVPKIAIKKKGFFKRLFNK